MKKRLFWIAGFLLAVFMLVLGAGIYRFNFTDDDIYVKMPDGSVISWDEYEQREQKKQHD